MNYKWCVNEAAKANFKALFWDFVERTEENLGKYQLV
jgi:hypothetical protein